jgi:serine protease Do
VPTPASAPTAAEGGRRGSLIGPLLAVALIAAVVTSAGQLLILQAAGLFAPDARPSAVTGQPVAQTTVQLDEESAVIRAAAAVSPAIVTIRTGGIAADDETGGGTGDPFTLPQTGVGSGIIYDAAGWILTNRHVVASSETVTVKLKDGREFQGNTYGIDTLTDLAIVKIEGSDLPVAPLGDSTTLEIGQLAIAIGSPLGDQFANSVTTGVVSAIGRSIIVNDEATGQPRNLRNLIQTDAAINPGNSGGALLDSLGQVIGVNTAVAGSAQGIGFAIPIEIAKPLLKQAIAGEPLTRPYIGIVYQSVDPQIKRQANLPIDYGAWISSRDGTGSGVTAGSPAEKAGLQEDDIITAIEGQRIDVGHPLDNVLVRYKPGDKVTVAVLRDGATLDLEVTLGTRPSDLE